jgi:hypothetical protein
MEKKVEDIQNEINELIRWCDEAAGTEFADESPELDKFAKLGFLLLRFQDGDLDEKSVHTLGEWLASDKEVLDYYVEFQNLSSLLYGYFNTQRQEQLLEKFKDSLPVRNTT